MRLAVAVISFISLSLDIWNDGTADRNVGELHLGCDVMRPLLLLIRLATHWLSRVVFVDLEGALRVEMSCFCRSNARVLLLLKL